MSDSTPEPTTGPNPDAFTLLMGPIALDQAEKALAKAIAAHVARVAVLKITRTMKTVNIANEAGCQVLIDFAQHVYGINPEQAAVILTDAIDKARSMLRKAL